MSSRKSAMHKIHRKTTQQLCKIRKKFQDKKDALAKLKAMYDRKEFDCIASKLNDVTSQFMKSQLRNVERTSVGRRWTEEDKTFALSMYKRSPRLYKYLTNYFLLPSTRTLKHILSKIPFDTGMNPLLLEQLKIKTAEMNELDRYCVVAFDEISLNSGYHYEAQKEQISGYEDLGELGRTSKGANHALVFMIRGLRRSWKQVIAYYFTAVCDTISCYNLKLIIKIVISQLQGIGLKVKGTVCDQGPTKRRALSELCAENEVDPTPYTFVVNQETIVTIYDVPHLLKCTRNCLLRCKIIFPTDKIAKFQYIKNAFDVEQNYPFKLLYKLTKNDFNFADSFIKMRVKVAARQLSHTVAATIHTRSVTNVNGLFPAESIQTAEFAQLIDDLFDSLNGCTTKPDDGKIYRCCLQDESPHISFWSKLLPQLATWKLVDLQSNKDVTNSFHFVKGWTITIRSVIYLWNQFKAVGFNYLNLRNVNQDPVENLFCQIRQHGVANTKPTCHQFVAALKTVVLNNLVAPISDSANCENDNCESVAIFQGFLRRATDTIQKEESESLENTNKCTLDWVTFKDLNVDASQALSYVSGYLVKKLKIPDENCLHCRTDLFCSQQEQHHLYTAFKEYSEKDTLTYPSDKMITLIENVRNRLFHFLNENGHKSKLESNFKNIFFSNYISDFCDVHRCDNVIVEKCLPFLIFKYVKDKKKPVQLSSGHYKKIKQFKST